LKEKIVKKKIEKSFDKGANSYDKYSMIQKSISGYLELMLEKFLKQKNLKKEISGLELGCGTGDFSIKLIKKINFEKIHLIDISKEMIGIAKKKIKFKNVSFQYMDFDKYKDFRKFDFIFSNMSLHWSEDFYKLLKFILNEMPKKSFFLCSFLNSSSFNYFKKIEKYEGEIFFNNFPNMKKINKIINSENLFIYQKEISLKRKFKNPMDFFGYLKRIGANAKLKKNKSNLFFLRKFNNEFIINFDVSCIIVEKLED